MTAFEYLQVAGVNGEAKEVCEDLLDRVALKTGDPKLGWPLQWCVFFPKGYSGRVCGVKSVQSKRGVLLIEGRGVAGRSLGLGWPLAGPCRQK